MPTADHLKQAEIAARMALTEPAAEKARPMHVMALESKEAPAPPPIIERQ
ncbi:MULTISPECIES: hypothetical protein [Bradyrhizobium]|nr:MULTISPECIES: hypothetical protein [Bradyrhizobium]MBR0709557.1 hypothetical protein [Bradyrhizobium liaoningense]